MNTWRSLNTAAAVSPAAGKVRIQAARMLPATPQRTADSFRVAPTPMTAEVVTCVVETGAAYAYAVVISTADATDWAANPAVLSSLYTRRPSVRIIRQPPDAVPALMARAQAIFTQVGTAKVERW